MGGQLANVPDSTVLPKCDVLARVASFKKVKSASGKLMYKVEFRVVDDGQGRFKNLPIFEQYVIGSEKDPDADNVKTWIEAPGARNMKRLFKKLGLDVTADVDDLVEQSEDQEIGLSITRYTEPDKKRDGSDNPYAGQPRNRVSTYWTPGEKEPSVTEEDGDEGGSTVSAGASASAKASTSAKAAPKAAAKPDPEEEDEPAPAATAAKTATKAAGKAATKAEKMLACPECDEQVAKSEFSAHIEQH